MKTISQIILTPHKVLLNGNEITRGPITDIYRNLIGDYPKFFKMDSFCRLGFVASELLLRDIPGDIKENAAIVLFNKNGSLVTDRKYQATIISDNYFPSPSLFVYTLANIITGEIAIRHKIYGETSFYVLPSKEENVMNEVVGNVFLTSDPSIILTGWVDYENEEEYIADLKIVIK